MRRTGLHALSSLRTTKKRLQHVVHSLAMGVLCLSLYSHAPDHIQVDAGFCSPTCFFNWTWWGFSVAGPQVLMRLCFPEMVRRRIMAFFCAAMHCWSERKNFLIIEHSLPALLPFPSLHLFLTSVFQQSILLLLFSGQFSIDHGSY